MFVPLVVWFCYILGMFTPYNTTPIHFYVHTLTLRTRLNTHTPYLMLCYMHLVIINLFCDQTRPIVCVSLLCHNRHGRLVTPFSEPARGRDVWVSRAGKGRVGWTLMQRNDDHAVVKKVTVAVVKKVTCLICNACYITLP